MIPLFVALPLAGAFLIPLTSKIWRRLAPLLANLITTLLMGLAIQGVFDANFREMIVYKIGGWRPPFGIIFGFDSLSALMVVVINVIGFAAILFSTAYFENYPGRYKFYTLAMLVIAGMNGMAITGDLFNLFVFMEISAIASYALIAFGIGQEDLEASFKYMVQGEIAGLSILLAIALIYAKASTLNMADLANTFSALPKTPIFWFIISIFLFGFSLKSGLIPFHSWLPDAYSVAEPPVATLLAGAFSKVVGVYAFSRIIFNIFGLTRMNSPLFFNILIGLGLISIVLGGFLALSQTRFQRLLAYSSISQVGYIFLGLGLGNYWGIVGALFHILAHALGKGLLFITAERVKNLKISDSLTRWSFILGMFSISGIPPLIGFFSKLFILLGTIEAKFYWLSVVVALSTILTLAYFLKIIKASDLKTTEPTIASKPTPSAAISMLFLVFLSAICGIGFMQILNWAVSPAAQALLRGADYAKLIFGQ